MRQDYPAFQTRGTEILVVGTDDRESFEYHWPKRMYPFVGLPDPEGTVPDLYGQQVVPSKFGRMPALMVIDQAGILRAVHYGNSMADIPRNGQVLTLLDQLQQEQERGMQAK